MRLTRLLMAVRRPKPPSWKRVNKNYVYTLDPPDSMEAQMENLPGRSVQKELIEPVKNWKFMKGDFVQIMKGKDKGKVGPIVDIVRERNWIVVEGLNLKYERVGQMKDYDGMYAAKEKPLPHREVMLIDPSDDQPCEVDFRYTESGDKVRVSRRTGRIIPTPEMTLRENDFSNYVDQPKDTSSEQACLKTFAPSMKSVEEDLIERYGLKDTRPPPKTYWYTNNS